MNCEVLHKEYSQLKTKVHAVVNGSQRGKPYEYIDYKDVLKIEEDIWGRELRHRDQK